MPHVTIQEPHRAYVTSTRTRDTDKFETVRVYDKDDGYTVIVTTPKKCRALAAVINGDDTEPKTLGIEYLVGMAAAAEQLDVWCRKLLAVLESNAYGPEKNFAIFGAKQALELYREARGDE